MCMLVKRTNILFDEDLWDKLVNLAHESGKSIGKLVRKAVVETYFSDNLAEEREAFKEILKLRKTFKGTIDYKALINEGRKY